MDKKELAELLQEVTALSKSDITALIAGEDDNLLPAAEIKKALKPHFTDFVKNIQDDYFKKGKRERMTEFEDNIRSEYKIKSKAHGEALVKELVDQFKKDPPEPAKGKKGIEDMTEAEIKAFVEGTDYFKTVTENLKTDFDKVKAEYDEFKTKQEKQSIESFVGEFALSLLDAANPELEDSESVVKTRKSDYIREVISSAKWRVNSDNTITLLDEAGNEMKDDRSRPIKPETFIKEIMDKRFVYRAADPSKKTPGQPPAKNPGNGVQLDKTTADLKAMGVNEAMKWFTSLPRDKISAGEAIFKEAYP